MRFYQGKDAGESSNAFQRRCQEMHLNDQSPQSGYELPKGMRYILISREEAEREYQEWLASRVAKPVDLSGIELQQELDADPAEWHHNGASGVSR